jgi:hypothetical protein
MSEYDDLSDNTEVFEPDKILKASSAGYADEEENKLPETYIAAAERIDSAYFSNDNYNEIQKEGDYSKEEMFEESGNKEVLEQAIDENK